jgi:hypothetical protein
MGVRDEDLLEEMIYDALETAHTILDNSGYILDSEAGYYCQTCGDNARWNHSGQWICSCGAVYDWEELFSGEEKYTEQTGKLANIIGHLEYGERDREVWFEILLQFVHGSGPMARFYIEGGCRTLSEVTFDQTRLEQVYWERT